MNFGEKVKDLRKRKRITQRQLAELLDVNFTYISKIENNRLEAPPSEKLIRELARILETDSSELLELAGKINPKALQDIAMEIPEASAVLRRMQTRPPSREQWERIKNILDENERD